MVCAEMEAVILVNGPVPSDDIAALSALTKRACQLGESESFTAHWAT